MQEIRTARQIGAAVRNRRKELSITQQHLADAANVSRGFVNRLEKGAATAVYPDKLIDVLSTVGLSLYVTDAASSPSENNALHAQGEAARESNEAPQAASKPSLSKLAMKTQNKEHKATQATPKSLKGLQIDAALLKPRTRNDASKAKEESGCA
ncbi:MAG: helix-turn-helix domain-containing protein [Eggerthellaceae bacterium]|nr:helix-turn-helix domain-containing protein [Eggerthellaceae bacterium]